MPILNVNGSKLSKRIELVLYRQVIPLEHLALLAISNPYSCAAILRNPFILYPAPRPFLHDGFKPLCVGFPRGGVLQANPARPVLRNGRLRRKLFYDFIQIGVVLRCNRNAIVALVRHTVWI